MNEPLVASERENLKIGREFRCFEDYNLENQGIFTSKAIDFQDFEFRLLKGYGCEKRGIEIFRKL